MDLSYSTLPRRRLNKPAAIAAIIVHVCMLALVWFGAQWVTSQPTEVELWDAGSLGGGSNSPNNETIVQPTAESETTTQIPEQSTEKSVVNAESTTPPESSKPDIETPASTPRQAVPNTPKPDAATKPASAPKPPNATANNSPRNDVLAQARSVNGSGRGSGSAPGNGSANYSEYIKRVKLMIEGRGHDQGLTGTSGSVSFRVSPSGTVTSISVSVRPPDRAEALKRIISRMSLPREDGVIPPIALKEGMKFNIHIK